MKADEEVLKVLIKHGGDHIWDRNAAVKVPRGNGRIGHVWRRTPPPEASFKRLSIEGYVQVETHNVSTWKFQRNQNDETTEWCDRVDIRVALTDSGWQHAANLGLLD